MEVNLIQQGDVLFKQIGAMPKGVRVKGSARSGLVTFAEGEVTGHHHSAVVEKIDGGDTDNITLYEKDGVLYCEVRKETTVTHQEHKAVTLPVGNFQIGIVREVDHLAEEIRSVAD